MKNKFIFLFLLLFALNINYGYESGIRIVWKYSTLEKVFGGNGSYPRIIRLFNNDLLCAFEYDGGCRVARSTNNGDVWSPLYKTVVPRTSIDLIAVVPELIQLKDSTILLAYNTRTSPTNTDTSKKFEIDIMKSYDNGFSWEYLSHVYTASHLFIDGCWEPAMIQLESGELQLFIANEFPYQNSSEQEITMFRSFDNGKTWVDTTTVSFKPNFRDGMPVPLILQNNKGIVYSIEDNGYGDYQFKPTIIWSSVEDNWGQGTALGNSPRRWRALKSKSRISSGKKGAAPYVRQLLTGETILSFQTTDERKNVESMCVSIGDDEAKNFSRRSYPFRVSEGRKALWNSVFVKDSSTVTAVTSSNTYNPDATEVWAIDGTILPEMFAKYSKINLDGILDEQVYSDASEMYIGAYSKTSGKFKVTFDENNLYIACEVADENLWGDDRYDALKDDAVTICLDTKNLDKKTPIEGIYKFIFDINSESKYYQGNYIGQWVEAQPSNIQSIVKINGSINDNTTDVGYTMEIKIPWSEIGGRPDTAWGINFSIRDDIDGGTLNLAETVSGNLENSPTTWCRINMDKFTSVITGKNNNIPNNIELYQNYPNPFNPATNIYFYLTQPTFVNLTVYDMLGREIKKILQKSMSSGNHTVMWNGKDNFGNYCSSGLYLYQLSAENIRLTKKMLLLQ